jgi:hypothetical protein
VTLMVGEGYCASPLLMHSFCMMRHQHHTRRRMIREYSHGPLLEHLDQLVGPPRVLVVLVVRDVRLTHNHHHHDPSSSSSSSSSSSPTSSSSITISIIILLLLLLARHGLTLGRPSLTTLGARGRLWMPIAAPRPLPMPMPTRPYPQGSATIPTPKASDVIPVRSS